MPDAPARVRHIPQVAGNEVAMEVGHRLARGCATVHADVVARGRKLLLNQLLAVPQHHWQVFLLIPRQDEVVRAHSVRDDQRVPRRNGVQVAHDKEEVVAVKDTVGRDL